jgi:hypothetical protein
MVTYDVIEIETGNIVLSDTTQEECVNWIKEYGNIIDYTIQEHQIFLR